MPVSPLVRPQAAISLHHSHIPALRKLTVEESDSAVILYGSVSSYYLKQLAQECLMPLLDGRELHNRVRVVRPDEIAPST